MSQRPVEGSSFFIRQELLRRGYNVTTFPGTKLLLIEKDGKFVYSSGSKTQAGNQMGFWISEKKNLTKHVLEHFGVPTAKGIKITRNTIDAVKDLQFPLVVKPVNLNAGTGVVIGIENSEQIHAYFASHPEYEEVLVEEQLEGEDVRVLIVRGKYFAALKRKPAFVMGDGVSTIQELVDTENARRTAMIDSDTKNGTYTTDLSPIVFDAEALRVIAEKGLSAASVPAAGEQVFVRKNANISMGGVGVDITDELCPEIRKQCEDAAKYLTMTFAGIDVMTTDLSKPLSKETKSGIVEVNASATLFVHILADEGTRRNPTPLLVDEIEEQFFK